MYSKLQAYFPIIAIMLIASAIGVWAMAAVMPRAAQGYSTINADGLNSQINSDGYNLNNNSIIKSINSTDKLDMDELNRRLLAEGLEPIIPPAEPTTVTQKIRTPKSHPPQDEPGTESEPTVENQPTSTEEISPSEKPETEVNKSSVNNEATDAKKNIEPAERYTKQPLIVPASYADCPKPVYPPAAERKGIEGKVILRVKVGIDGSALEIKLISSSFNRMLDRAAIDTVTSSWRFKPATRDGVNIESWVEVPITFKLGK